jgi:hypothetical protein
LRQSTLQNKRIEDQSLGSHLVCPHCHLMHIWGNCGHWDKDQVPAKSNSNVIPFKPKKEARPRKAKPLKEGLATFYAWEDRNGEIVKQRGFKDAKAKKYGKKGADLYCVGKFSKGGSGTNRTFENLVCVGECFSDLDPDFPLDWQEILECARSQGLPSINKIVRSRSDNHYQVHWEIEPAYKGTKGFDLWLFIQEKIFETFKALGADPLAVKNPIQYLRDPDKYELVYSNEGKTTLRELYQSFKDNGPVESIEANRGHKKRRRGQKSFDRVTLPRLRIFFKEHPDMETTHEEIYTKLEIAKSTYFYLLPVLYSEGLRTETIRVGKTWKTRVNFDSPRKDSFKQGGVYEKALGEAKQVGLRENFRNVSVFTLALWLCVARKWDFERVLIELESVFVVTVSKTTGFSRAEFERTVKSACSGRYLCFPKRGGKNKFLERMCIGLNLDCQNNSISRIA